MTLVIIFGAALAIPLFAFAVLYLEWFVLIGVLGTVCVPASLAKPGGFNVDSGDIFLAVAVAAWIVNVGVGRFPGPSYYSGRGYAGAAVAFWCVNALSFFWSVNHKSTLGFGVQLAELILIYPLVLGAIPSSIDRLRVGIYVFLAITIVLSLLTIEKYAAAGGAGSNGTSLVGFGKNPLGSFLGAGAVLSATLAFGARTWRPRVIFSSVALIDLLGTLATDSRGSLIGLVGALLLVVAIMESGRVNRKIGVLMIAIFVAGTYFLVLAPARQASLTKVGSYDSTDLRFTTWKAAIKKIEAKPLLGTGARTYAEQIEGGVLPDPNNLVLLTWAEVGIPGVIALLAMLYQIMRLMLRVRSLSKESLALAAGAAGIVISLLIHFQFDVSWSRGETTLAYAMVGVLIAVLRLSSREVEHPSEPPLGRLGPQWAQERHREPAAS